MGIRILESFVHVRTTLCSYSSQLHHEIYNYHCSHFTGDRTEVQKGKSPLRTHSLSNLEPRCQPSFRTCRIMLFILLVPGEERSSGHISQKLSCNFLRLEQGKLQAEDGWCFSIIGSSAQLVHKTEVAWEPWSLGPELALQVHLRKSP